MKAIKKNFWLKLALGTLFLVVLFAPASINLQKGEPLIVINKSLALITSLDISAITEANITVGTPGSVKINIQVTGKPDPNESVGIQMLEKGYAGTKKEFYISDLDKTVDSKAYAMTVPFDIEADEVYLVSAYTKLTPDTDDYKMVQSNGVEFTGSGSSINNNAAYGLSALPQKPEFNIGCNKWPSTWFTKCPVLFVYELIYQPLSFLTTLAAKFLDFFVYYSISSDAYRSGFVEKAWSVVRDISNMFFIIALLYIAVKTILQMNTSDNKRLIGYIVMVALLINFSLFATRVVIDASNILARVFYNNITPYDENGNAIPLNSKKPKSVSVGLVRTFDPQKVISNPDVNTGQFFIVTVIFIVLLFYMILMFISISMLFLGRVAGLWMAMMFSPLAFTSLAMPFPIPKFGFGKWKDDLFKQAFMAPVYAFFLYIIILFGGFLSQIQYDSGTTSSSMTGWLDALMKNIIPFMLIFALLKEAQTIAKDYAGEMGKTFSKAGAVVGGLALGATAGVAGFAGRNLIGRVGSYVGRNADKSNAVGQAVGWAGKRLGTYSYDVRNAKPFGKGLSDTGLKSLNTLSTPKTGGWEKIREEAKQKRLKRADEVSKVGRGEKERVDLRQAQTRLNQLMTKNEDELDKITKDIESARQNLYDAKTSSDGSPGSKMKISAYANKLKVLTAQKEHLRKGQDFNVTFSNYDETTGTFNPETVTGNYGSEKIDGQSISDLQKSLPQLKKKIKSKEKEKKLAYVKKLKNKWWSDGAKEAADQIEDSVIFDTKEA